MDVDPINELMKDFLVRVILEKGKPRIPKTDGNLVCLYRVNEKEGMRQQKDSMCVS